MMMRQPLPEITSSEFIAYADKAIARLKRDADPAVAHAASEIPFFVQPYPTREQAAAAGCDHCTLLGLWAADWPGYDKSMHGIVWIFEAGIRKVASDVEQQVFLTLRHEIDHALQRDHVLEHMKELAARGCSDAEIRGYSTGKGSP